MVNWLVSSQSIGACDSAPRQCRATRPPQSCPSPGLSVGPPVSFPLQRAFGQRCAASNSRILVWAIDVVGVIGGHVDKLKACFFSPQVSTAAPGKIDTT